MRPECRCVTMSSGLNFYIDLPSRPSALGISLEQFIKAVEQSIAAENWYAALALCLTLPDITVGLENPALNHRARFEKFHSRYLRVFYEFAPLALNDPPGTQQYRETMAKSFELRPLALSGAITLNQFENSVFGQRTRDQRWCWFGPEDFFGLRCAIIHDGTHQQEMRQGRVYKNYKLEVPVNGHEMHLNRDDDILQLQVDVLCAEICLGARIWKDTVGLNLTDQMRDKLLNF